MRSSSPLTTHNNCWFFQQRCGLMTLDPKLYFPPLLFLVSLWIRNYIFLPWCLPSVQQKQKNLSPTWHRQCKEEFTVCGLLWDSRMKYIIQLIFNPRIKANFTESNCFSRCLQNKILHHYLNRAVLCKLNGGGSNTG